MRFSLGVKISRTDQVRIDLYATDFFDVGRDPSPGYITCIHADDLLIDIVNTTYV